MVIERQNDEPFLWNANANGLNYSTKKRQSLHLTENLRDALLPTQNKTNHSPVFQTNSNKMTQYTLSMLSLPKC